MSVWLAIFIISTTKAEIPFTEAKGIYAATKEEYKHISPFWAMVAIHGRLLERIRFFGFYVKNTRGCDAPIDQQDYIAALLLKLFPSPDGVQFVANTRQKDPVGNLSRNLHKINDIIEILLSKEDISAKIQAIDFILASLGKTDDFAKILAQAYDQQLTYANPGIRDQQRYPENIVIISLLSFFVKVADNQDQLIDGLPLLFKSKNTIVKLSPYKIDDYVQYKSTTENSLPAMMQDPMEFELAFFMAKGFEAYERSVAEPLNYRSDTHFNPKADAFSDCGETALRNFFMLLLSAGNNGMVSPSNLQSLEDKIRGDNLGIDLDNHAPYTKFRDFMQDNKSITNGATQDVHDAWAQVVSNLNENSPATDINLIQYGRKLNTKKKDAPYVYEIKSNFSKIGAISIINMFNVIARIIPDQELNDPWSQDQYERYKQVEIKLSRLCKLFSRTDFEVGWKNETNNNYTEIDSDFMTIIFMVNNKDVFKWRFQDGHFQIDLVSNLQEDWRVNFSYMVYPNEWMASLFPRQVDIQQEADYAQYFPITVIYNPLLRALEGVTNTIKIVLDNRMENFYLLINRWIHRSIPLDNTYFLVNITDFLGKYLFSGTIDVSQGQIIEENIDSIIHIAGQKGMMQQNIVALALKDNQIAAAKILINRGANVDLEDPNGSAPLHLAILQGNMEILGMLLNAKANPDVCNASSNTPLHLAVSQGYMDIVDILIAANANINAIGRDGDTPLHFAVIRGNLYIVDKLLLAKANVNAIGKESRTPLHLAALRGNIEILNMLIASNANIDAKDNDGRTPLHSAALRGNIEILDRLIGVNANLEAKDANCQTPLHLAAFTGNLGAVEVLLRYGANPNTTAINDETILMSIAGKHSMTEDEQDNYIEIMKLLLDAGAQINAQDEWDDTCLDRAESKRHEKIVNFLKEKEAKNGADL